MLPFLLCSVKYWY